MTQNMGLVDRAIRLLLAILVVVLFAAGRISGWVGTVLGILAVILALTSLFGVCPLYMLLKFSTKAHQSAPPAETPPVEEE
jgi:Inner membrane protein YgaP-like, transmembrane domain